VQDRSISLTLASVVALFLQLRAWPFKASWVRHCAALLSSHIWLKLIPCFVAG
jgi:putative effector of murein hydrolase LrgA (UPF0299 family)